MQSQDQSEQKTFASDSGHFYWPDGRPAYSLIGANGKERNTTLRDARKLGLYPSVTGIIRLAAAPALEKWRRNQLLLAALTLPRMPDETETAWLARVETDSQEEGRKAADRGTAIHGAIERHFLGLPVDPTLMPWVIEAVGEVERVCGRQAWRAEKSFATPSGYGGKVDLHSPAWVIDFKGKDGLDGLRLWDDHHMQLAAYRRGLGYSNARCGILFVDRNRPAAKFVEAEEKDLQRGEAMFMALLAFHRAKTGYAP